MKLTLWRTSLGGVLSIGFMFLLPAASFLPLRSDLLSKTVSFPVLWLFDALMPPDPYWFLTQPDGNSIDYYNMYLGLCYGVGVVINAYVWGHASSFLLRRLLALTRRHATSPTAPIS